MFRKSAALGRAFLFVHSLERPRRAAGASTAFSSLPAPARPAPGPPIQVEVRCCPTTIIVQWSALAISEYAPWLRELRAAKIMSLIQSAKLNGHDPQRTPATLPEVQCVQLNTHANLGKASSDRQDGFAGRLPSARHVTAVERSSSPAMMRTPSRLPQRYRRRRRCARPTIPTA